MGRLNMSCNDAELRFSPTAVGITRADWADYVAKKILSAAEWQSENERLSPDKIRIVLPSEMLNMLVCGCSVETIWPAGQYAIGPFGIVVMNQRLAETHTGVIVGIDHPEKILYKIVMEN